MLQYSGTAKTVVLYSTHGTHSNRHERCCLTRIETSAKFRGIRLQITKNTPNLYIAICQPFCKHGLTPIPLGNELVVLKMTDKL